MDTISSAAKAQGVGKTSWAKAMKSALERLAYDALKNFDPVTLLASFPSALSVHPSVPANSVADLVKLIRANPGKYSYASPGIGTVAHLLGEQFRIVQSLDLVHVPFGGGGPAIASVVARHSPIAFAALSGTTPQAKAGKLRALAVMGETRSEQLPDVPTIEQAGHPDLGGEDWVGRRERAPIDAWLRTCRQCSCRVREPDETWNGEVGQGDPRCQDQTRSRDGGRRQPNSASLRQWRWKLALG